MDCNTTPRALLLALIALGTGCRDIWGYQDPTMMGGAGGTAGSGGTTGTGGCVSPAECPDPEPCFASTCVNGSCGVEPLPAGTLADAQTTGDCKKVVCNGKGAPTNAIDESDPFDDSKECTSNACSGSTPINDPVNVGTACAGGKCNALGECVECVTATDCDSGVCGPDATCLPAACNDKTKNGDESDIDCGGALCAKCGVGQKCAAGADCVSSVCSGVNLCACAQPACPIWSRSLNGGGEQTVNGIATDSAGNAYVVGGFQGAIDFGNGLVSNLGSSDAFVAKYDPQGGLVWAKTYGDAFSQIAHSIAIDGSGNVVVAGEMSGTVDFGGGAIASHGQADAFLFKLEANGTYIWSQRFGEALNQRARGVAVDGSNNVLLTGDFAGTVDFGAGALISAGNVDVFVAKFASDGMPLFQMKLGDSDQQLGYAIAADSSDNVFIAGSYSGAMTIGGTTIQGGGNNDIYVAKLSPAGSGLWAKSYGDSSYQAATALALDSLGSPVVVGTFQGAVNFDGVKPILAVGLHDAFVLKLNSLGNHVWSKQYGSTGLQQVNGVAIDKDKNVIITGSFENSIDFGGGSMMSAGSTDLFLAKLSVAGEQVWSLRAGDTASQAGAAVAVDPLGNVILGGNFAGTIDFGLGPIVSAGGNDVALATMGP